MKRFLSLFLCLVLMFSAVTTFAFGANTIGTYSYDHIEQEKAMPALTFSSDGMGGENTIFRVDELGFYTAAPEFTAEFGGTYSIFISYSGYLFIGFLNIFTNRATFLDASGELIAYLYVSSERDFLELINLSADALSRPAGQSYELQLSLADKIRYNIPMFSIPPSDVQPIMTAEILEAFVLGQIDSNIYEYIIDSDGEVLRFAPYYMLPYVERIETYTDGSDYEEMYGYVHYRYIEGLYRYLEPGESPKGIYYTDTDDGLNIRISTYTYRGNGHTHGSPPADHSIVHPGVLIVRQPGNMARTGHTFGGWRDIGGATLQPGFRFYRTATDPGAIFPLTARWVPNANVNITFNGNGGTPITLTTSKVPGTTLGALHNVERPGFIFEGWFNTSAPSGGTRFTSASIVPNSNLQLWARWRQNTGTITIIYSGNGNTGGTAPANQPVTTPGSAYLRGRGNLTRTGYTFSGWRCQERRLLWQESARKVWNNPDSGTVRMDAVWVPTPLTTIRLLGNEGFPAITTTLQRLPGTTVHELPATPLRSGHAFNGWFSTTAATGGTEFRAGFIIPQPTGSPRDFWARWAPAYTTLTFHGNSGTPATSVEHRRAGTVMGLPMPTQPTRANFTFAGWFNTQAATGGTQFTVNSIVPGTNTQYWARWNAVATTLTVLPTSWSPNSVASSATINVTSNTTWNVPTSNVNWLTVSHITPANRNGNGTFRINAESNTGAQRSGTITITGSGGAFGQVSVTQAAAAAQAAVTFNPNNGNVTETTRMVPVGSAVGALPNATRSGHIPGGWWTTINNGITGGNQISANTAIHNSVTFHARWNSTVTFNPAGGTVTESTRTVQSGTPVNTGGTLPVAIRDGYEFLGWFPPGTAANPITEGTIINGNITFTAGWERLPDPRRNVTLTMYLHRSNVLSASEAANVVNQARGAFIYNWNVNFLPTTRALAASQRIFLDECILPFDTPCNVVCGFFVNHKDSHRNLTDFADTVFGRDTDLGALVVTARMDALGRAFLPGRTSINDFRHTLIPGHHWGQNPVAHNVRLLQHELAHNFGIYDGWVGSSHYLTCTPRRPCLMNMDFFGDDDFSNSRIWCSVHAAQFDRNLVFSNLSQ